MVCLALAGVLLVAGLLKNVKKPMRFLKLLNLPFLTRFWCLNLLFPFIFSRPFFGPFLCREGSLKTYGSHHLCDQLCRIETGYFSHKRICLLRGV